MLLILTHIGISDTDLKDLSNHVAWRLAHTYSQPSMPRLAVGRFISILRQNFQDATREDASAVSHAKLLIFSAHDTTLMSTLHGWGLEKAYEGHGWPPYAATLRFDLLKETSKGIDAYHVRVIFDGRVVHFADEPTREVWPLDTLLRQAEEHVLA